MRAAWAGVALGITAGVAVLWSCTVDRRTDSLQCTSSSTCGSGRVCSFATGDTQGYCVVGTFRDAGIDSPPVCPSICPQCDFASHTCNATGAGSGNITCPAGWHCGITCGTQNACGNVTCTSALSCTVSCTATGACGTVAVSGSDTVDCSATSACGNVTAGTGTVTCSVDNACHDVTSSGPVLCQAAGACNDVRCTSGTCAITCDGDGTIKACNSITCTGKCTDNCNGSNSCGTVSIGAGGGSATCNGGSACGNVTCSDACDVTCEGGSASCGTITTGGSGSAIITCNGSNACGNITSGAGYLGATCENGLAACGNINCSAACRCDVACMTGDCGTNTCPTAAANSCSIGGICTSSASNQCANKNCP